MPTKPNPRQMVPVDRVLVQRLRAIRERDGVPITESARRAIRAYLEQRELLESTKPRKLDVHA